MVVDPRQWDPIQPTPGIVPPQPASGSPASPYPRMPVLPGSGGSLPSTPATGGAPVGTDQSGHPPVGTAAYDLWTFNDLLRTNWNGWQMIGQPVEVIEIEQNPDDPDDVVNKPTGIWVINARDPNTGAVKQFKVVKMFNLPGGGTGRTDPETGEGYSWSPISIVDQQRADPSQQGGHSDIQAIGDTLYGTNRSTGAFEAVPGAPKIPPGAAKWSDFQLIPQPDGSQRWYGIDPVTRQPTPIPGMPDVPAEKPGPGTISSGGTVYIKKPDGTYGPASGIPDPNPPVGTTRNVLDNNGYIVQEVYRGGGRWDFDPSFETIPYTDAAKQARGSLGAQKKAGERGEKVINGMVYQVIYRGGGDDNYDFDTTIPAKPYPGAIQPQAITTGTEQEFIAQRMPDGSIQQVKNPNYQATDVAGRVRQLNEQAKSKLAELSGRISESYTADQAQAEFDQWWDQTVTPVQQQLAQQQEKERIDTQLKLSAEQRAAYTQAQQAGQNAVSNYTAMAPYRVGPGFGEEMNKISRAYATGKAPEQLDFTRGFTYQIPDLNAMAQQATANALKSISPMAAGMAGGMPSMAQVSQGVDLQAGLNRQNYRLGGGGTTTTILPGGAVKIESGGTGEQPAQPAMPAQFMTPLITNEAGQPTGGGWLGNPYQYPGQF